MDICQPGCRAPCHAHPAAQARKQCAAPRRGVPASLFPVWSLPVCLLAGSFVLRPLAAEDSPQIAGEERRECLCSVLPHCDGIFASTARGLYRASYSQKKWARLLSETRLERGGHFAAEDAPPGSNVAGIALPYPNRSAFPSYRALSLGPIYYFTPHCGRHVERGRVGGLYRLENDCQKCIRLSAEYDFRDLYVRGATLFAIVQTTERYGTETACIDRILRSSDAGKRWEDISHGIGRGVQLLRIFRDPDRESLVCVYGNCARDYMLQAADDSYQWKMTRFLDWDETHMCDQSFFQQPCPGSRLYFLRATLANYFDYPFGDLTEISSLQIVIAPAYTFKPGQRRLVSAKICFWHEGGGSLQLVDVENGYECWGLRRTSPNGKREDARAGVGADRDSHRVTAHRLTDGQSFDRSLDLSAFADFSARGIYHVQLIYYSGGVGHAEKGDWCGSFSSPVFDVKIE